MCTRSRMRGLKFEMPGRRDVSELGVVEGRRRRSYAERLVESLRTAKPWSRQSAQPSVFSCRSCVSSAISVASREKAVQRLSCTMPAVRPLAVRRVSALSARADMRYSEREVNMR
jgi:hypothetical protein